MLLQAQLCPQISLCITSFSCCREDSLQAQRYMPGLGTLHPLSPRHMPLFFCHGPPWWAPS